MSTLDAGHDSTDWPVQDATVEEWLVTPGACFAAGMAQLEDGNFYAAAPVAGDAGQLGGKQWKSFRCLVSLSIMLRVIGLHLVSCLVSVSCSIICEVASYGSSFSDYHMLVLLFSAFSVM